MANDFEREIEKFIREFKSNFGDPVKLLYPIVALFIIVSAFSSFYTVEPDEEAVIIRLGKYLETRPPGLHFKIPFIDRNILVKTTKIHQEEFGFRTRDTGQKGRTRYSGRNFQSESLMLTGDLNVADVEWVVQYKISDSYKFLFKAQDPIQNIRDVSQSIMRRVVGDRSVNDVLTIGRVEIANDSRSLMQEILDKYDIGIYLTAVKLQDVNPPESVKPSFNEVNEAKQEQEKLINQAEKEYNRVIPEARGKAEKLISQAEGEARAKVNRARGDSEKFKAILKEYKKAPKITRQRLYLETMGNIFSNFEDVTIVDPSIKGLLPVYQQNLKATKGIEK